MPPRRSFSALCLAALCVVLACAPARAADGTRVMGRYLSRQWSTEQGLNGGRVSAIAQTPDGYLWVGTEQGLFRFDGTRFTPMYAATGVPIGHVTTLTVDSDGALWILTDDARLLRSADGTFVPVLSIDDAEAAVISVAPAQGKGVIADGLSHGVVHLTASSLTPLPISSTSLLLSLAQTTDGRIWLGTREAGLLVWKDGKLSSTLPGVPDMKINCLLPTPGGQLWIGTDNGLALWDGHTITPRTMPPGIGNLQILAMAQDRDGSLWAGTSRGLLRYDGSHVDWVPRTAHTRDTAVSALVEDREGDLWFGDGHGLTRLRDSALMTFGDSEGPSGDQYGATFVDSHNRAWFAPLAGGLFWMRDGISHQVSAAGLDHDVVYSLDGQGDDLWIGRQQGGLTRLHEATTAQTWTTAQGLAQNSVYTVRVMHDGSLWAGTLTGGASHLVGGASDHKTARFLNVDTRAGLSSNTVSAIEEGGDGTVWFATPLGVSTLHGTTWKSFGSKDGLPSTHVLSLLAEGERGMWIGTSAGLVHAVDTTLGRFNPALTFHEPILGMAEDASARLWITTTTHVLSVSRAGLLRGSPEAERVYGLQDGLESTEGVQRSRSVVRDSLGRVWLTTTGGLSVTSPYLGVRPVEALAHIETVVIDGVPATAATSAILPSGARRVAIDFTGLDLRDPERVRFRYRLDHFDKTWGAPTSDRQAVYTNLAPGNYTFHVMASDGNGEWGTNEATLRLSVQPFLWQRLEFQIVCLVLVLLIAVWIYRARVQHVIAQAGIASEQRLIERTRIARELHDTLLQSFISALLHLHVTMETVPEKSSLRNALQQVLEVMERVVEEARLAVLGLRTVGDQGTNLEQLFRELMGELGQAACSEYRVQVEGDARTFQPMAYEEICRIGREAILNATQHAEARLISIRIEYTATRFELEIVDDGRGMEPSLLLGGRNGHWGIAGMRERANRAGAQLQITSRPGAGTRVLLIVPASAAYARATK